MIKIMSQGFEEKGATLQKQSIAFTQNEFKPTSECKHVKNDEYHIPEEHKNMTPLAEILQHGGQEALPQIK